MSVAGILASSLFSNPLSPGRAAIAGSQRGWIGISVRKYLRSKVLLCGLAAENVHAERQFCQPHFPFGANDPARE